MLRDHTTLGLTVASPAETGLSVRWQVWWIRTKPKRWVHFGEVVAPFHWLAHAEACEIILGLPPNHHDGARNPTRSVWVGRGAPWGSSTDWRPNGPTLALAERLDRDPGALSPWQVMRLKALMLSQIGRRVSLAEMAAHLGLAEGSRPYVVRGFKAFVGATPYQWQLERRLWRARMLLRRTDWPIGVIAQQLGYASSQTFAKVFTREVGMAPRDWRHGRADVSALASRPVAA